MRGIACIRCYQIVYMGTRAGATTRANVSTSTWAAPARRSAAVQASTVAPVVSTSSTSTSRRAPDGRAALRRHLEGALHVRGALRAGKPDLLGGCLDAPQRGMNQRHAALRGDDIGEQRRLVEASPPL